MMQVEIVEKLYVQKVEHPKQVNLIITPANGARIEINGYYYDGRGTNILAEYEDDVWDINQYR